MENLKSYVKSENAILGKRYFKISTKFLIQSISVASDRSGKTFEKKWPENNLKVDQKWEKAQI